MGKKAQCSHFMKQSIKFLYDIYIVIYGYPKEYKSLYIYCSLNNIILINFNNTMVSIIKC